VEVSLGKRVAAALRAEGWDIVHHDEVLAPDVSDEVWVAEAARNGWVVLTKDAEIRRKPNELEAIRRSGLRVFVLSRGNWTSEEMAAAFIRARGRMARFLRRTRGALIARVTRNGDVMVVLEEDESRPWPTSR
jgi:predicted nuclease of predicted toxin-antitoxin system